MNQTLVITGIAFGIVVNLIAVSMLIYKLGNWSGRVMTMLEEHDKDHRAHYRTTDEHGQRIAHLEGKAHA